MEYVNGLFIAFVHCKCKALNAMLTTLEKILKRLFSISLYLFIIWLGGKIPANTVSNYVYKSVSLKLISTYTTFAYTT